MDLWKCTLKPENVVRPRQTPILCYIIINIITGKNNTNILYTFVYFFVSLSVSAMGKKGKKKGSGKKKGKSKEPLMTAAEAILAYR